MTLNEKDRIVTSIPMPLGIITSHRGDTIHFDFTLPAVRQDFVPGTKFTIWNWVNNAYAAGIGEVTEVGQHTGAGIITKAMCQENWPDHADPFGLGMPVYLLAPDQDLEPCLENFLPNPNCMASLGELKLLLEFAEEHQAATGIPIHGEAAVRSVIAHYEQKAADFPATGTLLNGVTIFNAQRRSPGL